MTEDSFDDELSEAEEAQLAAFLGEPALWEEPTGQDEDAIVAAIRSEVAARPVQAAKPAGPADASSNVVPISRARRWVAPLAAAAAAAVIVVAGFSFASSGDPDGVVLALAGTDNAPAATAEAIIAPLDAGTRIILDVSGLAPAEPGTYYEAWMRKDAEIGVSAGTFHLRGGDDQIELWSGVVPSEYPLITVTLQTEAQSESSGVVVLKGLLNIDDLDGLEE